MGRVRCKDCAYTAPRHQHSFSCWLASEDDDDGNADDNPSDLGYRRPRTNRTPSGRGDGHRRRPRKWSVAAAKHHDKGGDPKRVHPRTRREDYESHLWESFL